ncbi:hypothetical protein GH714_033473 [Hevea brasiliensis]|uniref:Uncharacterized protein n=1 Tax=Hevea brasiliensis TaxID=3981 RepID=A0A6A6N914_HEVBR|nr:hypothetical protein GH714_033473 [Hevea brasiliensis]
MNPSYHVTKFVKSVDTAFAGVLMARRLSMSLATFVVSSHDDVFWNSWICSTFANSGILFRFLRAVTSLSYTAINGTKKGVILRHISNTGILIKCNGIKGVLCTLKSHRIGGMTNHIKGLVAYASQSDMVFQV